MYGMEVTDLHVNARGQGLELDQGFSLLTAGEENQDMLAADAVEKLQKQHTVGTFGDPTAISHCPLGSFKEARRG